MKLKVDFSLLENTVKIMGASDIVFEINFNAPPLEAIDVKLNEGFELSLDQIDFKNGLANYEGRQVLLYIKDHGHTITAALENPKEKGRKFHIADCTTLKEMRQKKRFDRYVITNDLSGFFTITGYDQVTKQAIKAHVELSVCKNCLKFLNYQNYQLATSGKNSISNNFKIANFFDTYSSFFPNMPSGIANRQSSFYPENWNRISTEYRIKKQYVCENCGVNLSTDQKLLHVHHINGVKGDCSTSNLKALCLDCHKKQPNHDHLFMPYEQTKRINDLRSSQNKIVINNWKDVCTFIDTALHGVASLLNEKKHPLPFVNYYINLEGGKKILLNMAWKENKIGISLDSPSKKEIALTGWKIYTMNELLDKPNHFYDNF